MENIKAKTERIRTWISDECDVEIEAHRKGLGRALVMVYNKQTADEKMTESTQEDNGVGFNGVDAPILSSIAEFYKQRGYISPKQAKIVKKKLKKYAKQIAIIQADQAAGRYV